MHEVHVACPCCKNKRLFDADPNMAPLVVVLSISAMYLGKMAVGCGVYNHEATGMDLPCSALPHGRPSREQDSGSIYGKGSGIQALI